MGIDMSEEVVLSIKGEIKEVKEELKSLRDMLIENNTTTKELCRQNTRLFKDIEGNGKPGIKQDITAIKQIQADCRERQRNAPAAKGNTIAIWAICVSILSPFLTFGLMLLAKKMGITV